MISSSADEQNLVIATSSEQVDKVNAEFYGTFPYPWRPARLDRIMDEDFSRKLLCQGIGDWQCASIPTRPDVWVAGCGTNQAAITALNFPGSKVVGSDISGPSIALCLRTATELSLSNLELRQESLNHVQYREAFDYVLCTGVIHHNAKPEIPLQNLMRALRPHGLLELMVYNRFHRTFTSAFQKAVRIMATDGGTAPQLSTEMSIATALVNDFPVSCQMRAFLNSFRQTSPEKFADALIQPVEYNYTVQTIKELAQSCGLDLLAPAMNIFDRARGTLMWNLQFNSPELEQRYYALDDAERWQVTNLLLCESSPMLWFYVRRADSGIRRVRERELCDQFLEKCFGQATTMRQGYALGTDGKYQSSGRPYKYPPAPSDNIVGKIVNGATGSVPMRELFKQHGVSCSFPKVNEMRLKLATPVYPYLIAAGGPES
jgi:SAM-dependent methyltransferase